MSHLAEAWAIVNAIARYVGLLSMGCVALVGIAALVAAAGAHGRAARLRKREWK